MGLSDGPPGFEPSVAQRAAEFARMGPRDEVAWRYADPGGQTHGAFSLAQLERWRAGLQRFSTRARLAGNNRKNCKREWE